MQSKNIHNQKKRLVNKFTKYKEVNANSIKVNLILGKTMHRVDITFRDGNHIKWSLFTVENNIILSKPRMWEYTLEKLATMDYLTDVIFSNDSYTIMEDKELHVDLDDIKRYKIKGEIETPEVIIYSLATDTFHERHFIDYDIRVISKVAKDYKFPTNRV